MSITVCLSADTLGYPEGGGHLWAYLNWALALRSAGCKVIWLEGYSTRNTEEKRNFQIAALKQKLRPHGLADSLALYPMSGDLANAPVIPSCLSIDAASEADFLFNMRYGTPESVVRLFRRTALLDIDPGLLQKWINAGDLVLPRHDVHFSIGETVGTRGGKIPDTGAAWHHTAPCIALDAWPATPAPKTAPFTTVTHWYADEWMEEDGVPYANDKRSGFLPFLELPGRVSHPLELALNLADDPVERGALEKRGWRVRDSHEVAATPSDYQAYIQNSFGEFSCAKPSCVRLQNAWISDRTLCYLASGKPAVVQHTGPSRMLPDAAGLFRFRTLDEAAAAIEAVVGDYDRQCVLARALAEEYFDGRKVVRRILEKVFT